MGEGKDDIVYPYNGNSNEARVWISASTINKCIAAGGSTAMIALLSTIFGNLAGPVQGLIGIIVGYGITVIAQKIGSNNGAVMIVGLNQVASFGVSSWFGYDPVWDIQMQ
jgi:hypothetical protein